MSTLLSKAATAGKLTVKILLDTLAIVAEFEGWVVKKFASPVRPPSPSFVLGKRK